MFKILLAAVWLVFSLYSLLASFTSQSSTVLSEDKVPTWRMLMGLRATLGKGGQDLPALFDRLHEEPEKLEGFRRALFLNAGGLIVELILYFAVTLSFEGWGALILGALVIASHLHSLTMLLLLAFMVKNRNWFILTFKKLQVLVKPVLIVEIIWLAYLLSQWTGLLTNLL